MWLSCLLPNHISRVSKPVLDGTTWIWGTHSQQTPRPRVLRLSGFRCIAASSLSACFSGFCLREGTSPIYGQHGHHSFDSSLPSSSNHIGQGRKLWHHSKFTTIYLKHAMPSPNTAALASRPTCLTVSRVRTFTSRKSRQTFPFFPESDVSICSGWG